ncbi:MULTISPECIES: DUF6389 family protein [unclassified Mycolicibacterium]|uniref:DUF6389 family protein n=1 Tax=unclassified Mycolicibacterium TaxID=2636767 RepID=UPI0012DDAEB3|nr:MULTISPECIES: DUF6389 family protein [unclassified Mycolicibacterium]MUL80214.1 hypothetical protein [Mycolicibacterium sp. CBMA 329]MUL85981.1 hypothetical protein [Mycolicibacterium sp. CBMA 331]MUM00755.1 hypothetical protein [Mycolicibacterium sp. CBMA 334]MUM28180.1 hypothetical protein [Mycolicibacterium sp. CBMA 295]MUM36277.1 hypothetical protein [Mycolicibacterium sp. CBMA 247]
MGPDEYCQLLARALAAHSEQAASRLQAIVASLPEAAIGIEVGVFADQDGEGTFDVSVALAGPDSYVLNQAITAHRELFTFNHDNTAEIDLPMFASRGAGFCVQDVIVDAAADWVESLWSAGIGDRSQVGCVISGDEDYGTTTPRSPGGLGSRAAGGA